MFLLFIFIIGEVFSIITFLYMSYFGNPDEIFTNYEDNIILFISALFGGWIVFPFFGYVLYKQIQYNNKQNRKG